LRRFDFSFPTFRHDLALIVDDLTEFGHGEVLKDARFLALIAELLDEFDEGLVLFVEARRGRKEEDALKQRLPRPIAIEFAEDIEQLLCLSTTRWRDQTKGCWN
jgi:hypothetical protein